MPHACLTHRPTAVNTGYRQHSADGHHEGVRHDPQAAERSAPGSPLALLALATPPLGPDGVRIGDRCDAASRAPSKPAGTTSTLLDVTDAAKLHGVTERFVRRLVAERRIPFYEVGKFIRFESTDVVDWIDARRIEPRR